MNKKRYEVKGRNQAYMKLYKILRFDLKHNSCKKILDTRNPFMKKGISETCIDEKENNREYNNA